MSLRAITRRDAFCGATAFAVGFTAVSIPTAEGAGVTVRRVDPIFAAIEHNLTLWDAHCRSCATSDEAAAAFGFGSKEARDAEAIQKIVCQAHIEDLDNLLAVVPTTLAGVAAYLDFLNHVAAFKDVGMEPWHVDTVLSTLKSAVASLAQA